jgi:hypothetical protein
MTPKAKRRLIFAGVTFVGAAFLLVGFALHWLLSDTPESPESNFRDLFTELSVGPPEYQKLYVFNHPDDAIRQDFFSAEISQSEPQFRQFAAKLGVPRESILSSTGIWVRADSKINPDYPWWLDVRAEPTGLANKSYKVHIEEREPYNKPRQ